jgi:hypothetical protein
MLFASYPLLSHAKHMVLTKHVGPPFSTAGRGPHQSHKITVRQTKLWVGG